MGLVCAISFAILTPPCRAAENVAGRWEGSVQIPGRELKVIVDLAPADGKTWTGSITIPGLNVKGAALADFVMNGSDLTFAIKSALGAQRLGPAKLNAHRTAKGTLAGDFVQAGNTAPFVLEKTGPPQVELPPRSTPVNKELQGEWNGEFELLGYPRHVTIKLANRAAEGATGEFVVVGKKTTNVPVDLVTQEGDLLTIDSPETGISYEGRLNKEAAEIKGTFIQGAIELPLVLHRAK